MTRFYVNEREILPPLDASSLDEVLKHVEAVHLPPNSVIRQINIDGLPLTAETFNDSSSESLNCMDSREKIEFFTGTIREIASESIKEAIVYLERIERIAPRLADEFQVSPGPQTFGSLRELYEGFYWLTLLFDKLNNSLHIRLEDICIQGESAKIHHEKFVSILKRLVQSQEKGDLVLISDLIEFEILPVIAIWKEMFVIMREKVSAAL